jgi:hypothetical protein
MSVSRSVWFQGQPCSCEIPLSTGPFRRTASALGVPVSGTGRSAGPARDVGVVRHPGWAREPGCSSGRRRYFWHAGPEVSALALSWAGRKRLRQEPRAPEPPTRLMASQAQGLPGGDVVRKPASTGRSRASPAPSLGNDAYSGPEPLPSGQRAAKRPGSAQVDDTRGSRRVASDRSR